MQDIIFALLLIGFNIVLFFLMDMNFNVNALINKKRLLILLVVILVAVIIFFASDPEKYRATFFMSLSLFLVMGLRFIIYKFLAPPPENDTQGGRILRKFFDRFLFPFFLFFISFGQIMFLFVLNS
jgi:hypothetical protein